MSAIKSRDTTPEVYFRKKLFSLGLRYRKNFVNINGHPDLFFSKFNTAVFVNGCFWHRHNGCKFAYTPKSNIDFWIEKFNRNLARDQFVREKLYSQNIKCLIIWECTIDKMKRDISYESAIIDIVISFFSNNELFLEI